MSQKVIVTGSRGFIGRRLVPVLKKNSYRVATFDLEQGNDVRDEVKVLCLSKATVVFHLAALANVPYSFDHPHEVLDVNVRGVLNFLEYCRRAGAKLIFPSTAYVYGRPQKLPISENHPLDGPNAYVESKIVGERLCRLYAKNFGVKVVILRFFNVYGPSQTGGVIPDMIGALLKSKQIEFRDGTPKRDFIFIDDVVAALIRAADFTNVRNFNVFNIGFGRSYSISQLAQILKKVAGGGVELIDRHAARPGEVAEVVADISHASKVLGWQPATSLEAGLKKTYLAAQKTGQ